MNEHDIITNDPKGKIQNQSQSEGQYLGKPVNVENDTEPTPSSARKSSDGKNSKIFPHLSMDSKLGEEQTSTDNANEYDMNRYKELIRTILNMEAEEKFLPQHTTENLTALPLKEYLDATVIPILIQALEYLATYRPPEPINALCVYLLKYRDEFEKPLDDDQADSEKSEEEPEPEPEPEPKPEKPKKGKK